MKITIINGSPRKGNTYTAIETMIEAAKDKHEFQVIEADKLNISGCKGCSACQCSKGCVAKDDTNKTVDKLVDSDMIVFATPVYWWGITAQIKLVIDKCYCKGIQLKGKKIGLLVIGGASTDDEQYDLIEKQFTLISNYLNWDIVFSKKYSATGSNDLAGNEVAIKELKELF